MYENLCKNCKFTKNFKNLYISKVIFKRIKCIFLLLHNVLWLCLLYDKCMLS